MSRGLVTSGFYSRWPRQHQQMVDRSWRRFVPLRLALLRNNPAHANELSKKWLKEHGI